jgi:hypothetical protein
MLNNFKIEDKDQAEIYIKEWKIGIELIVAICDSELLGKKFSEGKLTIDIRDSFYGNTKASLKYGLERLKKATIANIVGEKIVGAAINEGLISRESVIFIGGIPHAQVIK